MSVTWWETFTYNLKLRSLFFNKFIKMSFNPDAEE